MPSEIFAYSYAFQGVETLPGAALFPSNHQIRIFPSIDDNLTMWSKTEGFRASTSRQKKSRMMAKKSVRFSETTQTIRSSHHSLSRDDIRAICWYVKDDFYRFKLDCDDSVRASIASTRGQGLRDPGTDIICTRGLEHIRMGRQANELRKSERAALIRMVLARQNIHRLAGSSNPEVLRSISEKMSLKSKRVAMAFGRHDHESSTRLNSWSARAA